MFNLDELWRVFEIRVIPGPQPSLYGVAFRPKDSPVDRGGRRPGKPPTVFVKVGGDGGVEVIAHLALETFPGLRQVDFERRAVEEIRRTVNAAAPDG